MEAAGERAAAANPRIHYKISLKLANAPGGAHSSYINIQIIPPNQIIKVES